MTLVDSEREEYCNELTTMVKIKIFILARIELIQLTISLIGINRIDHPQVAISV